MKNKFIYFIVAFLALFSVSCKKWLDVKPEDKITELQVFSNAQNIYNALNSIYVNIAKPVLYGQNLTMSFTELLGQQYNIGPNHDYYPYAQYSYGDSKVKATIENIWSSAYVNVASANNFLASLDKYPSVISKEHEDIVRGEAYALRAFLHFDLLRLFGPVYKTADSSKPAIPYYTAISSNYNPYLPANAVVDKILNDIYTAEQYLENDPVVGFGTAGNANDDPFFTNRGYRLNLYAVKALEARVQLYRGNKPAALTAAKYVIDNAQPKFPWVTSAQILSEKNNPNRIFSSEILFGTMYTSLYNVYQNLYDPNLADFVILAPLDNRLKAVYEDPTYPNDFRYLPSWILPSVSSKTYRTFFKYADVIDKTRSFRLTIPLIRISEMYYIAAECEPDPSTAISYLNTVRYNRGISNLPNNAVLATEIKKEYMKEFYGEGQLFYYYKRINSTTIPNGAATSGNITMSSLKYVVPVPPSETDFH